MKHIIISGALALAAITSCTTDDGTGDDTDTSATQQSVTESFLGCSVTATKPMTDEGTGEIGCPPHVTWQLQACLQQLVTGGWENVGGIACHGLGPSDTGNSSGGGGTSTGTVSFFTANRWYRTQVYVIVQQDSGPGGDHYTYSDTCKGNGGSGCN
jgi:hypothetical protein